MSDRVKGAERALEKLSGELVDARVAAAERREAALSARRFSRAADEAADHAAARVATASMELRAARREAHRKGPAA